jgi:hypothetical protein
MTIMKSKETEWLERIRILNNQIQYWIDNATDKTIEINSIVLLVSNLPIDAPVHRSGFGIITSPPVVQPSFASQNEAVQSGREKLTSHIPPVISRSITTRVEMIILNPVLHQP